MKWFKHETTAHTNLKLQTVIDRHGAEAYGYYWACIEIVGLEGTNFRLSPQKNWKNHLKKILGIDLSTQDTYLSTFGEINLIDKKALKTGSLFIPKLDERCDEYSKKLLRVSGHYPDNVRLEETRREEKRLEQNIIDLFNTWWILYPPTHRNIKKDSALTKFVKGAAKDEVELKRRIEHLKDQKSKDRKWLAGYIPNMSTYLNQERWNMDIEVDNKGVYHNATSSTAQALQKKVIS